MRLGYWGEDAQKIINKIMTLWDEVDELSDSVIRDRLQSLRNEWTTLDARFLHGINPYNNKVLGLAEKEAKELMKNVYIANHGTYVESNEEVTA